VCSAARIGIKFLTWQGRLTALSIHFFIHFVSNPVSLPQPVSTTRGRGRRTGVLSSPRFTVAKTVSRAVGAAPAPVRRATLQQQSGGQP